MKHHPDRGGDENTIKDINNAYAVLSDPMKKAEYDSGGSQKQKPFKHWSQFFDDEMADMFGMRQRFNPVQTVAVNIDIKDIITGAKKTISLNGVEFDISIPKMFPAGEKIIIVGMAEKINGKPYTDLHVIIRWAVPENMDVRGLDVYQMIDVDVLTMVFGGAVQVRLLDDTDIEVSISGKTKFGTILRVAKRGLKTGQDVGDLYLKLNPVMTEISDGKFEEIKKIINPSN